MESTTTTITTSTSATGCLNDQTMKERIFRLIEIVKTLPLKKRFTIIVLIVIALAAIPFTVAVQQLQQNTRQFASTPFLLFYVSTSGNDSNPGTKDSPFASINKAASLATAGTIVHVADGTYNETVITNISATQLARITFTSDNKWGAKIVSAGTPDSTDATWENNADYIDILGFDVSGGKRIGILNRGSHVNIKQNKVHDISVGYCESSGGAGIDSAYSPNQQDNEYSGNLVVNVGPKPCSYVHGIYIQSLNEKVMNNIIVNNGGIGVACTHGCNSPVISNNTIFNNGYGIRIGWSTTNPVGKTENAIVTNNIILNNAKYAIYEYTTGLGTNNQLSNNILLGNNPNTCSANDCQNTLSQDPQMVNPLPDGSGDYHLKNTSPAIDTGTSNGAPTTDYDGSQRPQKNGFDIGAYEYTAQVSSTPTPTPSQAPTRTCVTRPTCLDANPRCLIAEPKDGWCPSPTPTGCIPECPNPPLGCHYEGGTTGVNCSCGKLVCTTPTPTPTPKPTSPSDINGDGKVNNTDYSILISCSVYLKNKSLCNQSALYKTRSDLNADGRIDLDDITILVKLLSGQR